MGTIDLLQLEQFIIFTPLSSLYDKGGQKSYRKEETYLIHILDGQKDTILDYITLDNIISDDHKKSLEDTLETYTFITFADKRFSEHLEKRNRFIIPDEDGTLQEFVMFEGAKYKDSEGHKAQVFAHASYLELKKANVLYPDSFKGTASQHAGRTLDNTGWQVENVEVTGN